MINSQDLIFKNILLSLKESPESVVTTKELSIIFKETRSATYNRKRRNSIPFKKIFKYCEENNIDADKIFLHEFQGGSICRKDFLRQKSKMIRIPYFKNIQERRKT